MDFTVFDTKKLDEYAARAKEQWGKSAEYKEFEQKTQGRSKEAEKEMLQQFMLLFVEFGKFVQEGDSAETERVQAQVKKLQDFITEHFYKCSKEILFQLGQMYAGGGEFTENINAAAGEGTAEFTAEAIRVYCGK